MLIQAKQAESSAERLVEGSNGRLEQFVVSKPGELHSHFTSDSDARVNNVGDRAPRADRALGGCCAPSRACRDGRAEARLAR
jgi:hypothetical protein